MLLEYLESSASIALMFVGVAAFFWIVLTLSIRNVNKGVQRTTREHKAEDLEKDIDAEIAELRKQRGFSKHPTISA
ncbi:hypothetical protein [Nisaea sp.]|uniref:hypothetical protein n=1 Tax=Nisaea sp. TaxID=2024842 RepID=UPI0032EED0F1